MLEGMVFAQSQRPSRLNRSGVKSAIFTLRFIQKYLVTLTSVTVTVLINSMLPKSVTVSKYLLTLTLIPCPEGVTVTEDVCTGSHKTVVSRFWENCTNIASILERSHQLHNSPLFLMRFAKLPHLVGSAAQVSLPMHKYNKMGRVRVELRVYNP